MPFKFNAKRVQAVSKDFTSSNLNNSSFFSANNGNERNSNYNNNNDSNNAMDFGPLPSMPNSLNLPRQSPPSAPLKSILKRNPPPPPILSNRNQNQHQQPQQGQEKYRPESPLVRFVPQQQQRVQRIGIFLKFKIMFIYFFGVLITKQTNVF
jgi:hypothetical protein